VTTVTSLAKPLAVLSALAQEQQGLVRQLVDAQCVRYAGRDFWCGQLQGTPVVLALSRIGKVAAATTAAALIERFGVGQIVFTGVAGGVGDGVQVGDIVVGTGFVQHDMDASPLFPRYQIPLTGQTVLAGDLRLTDLLTQASRHMLSVGAPMNGARVHSGLIASGDRFVNGAQEVATLVKGLRAAGHAPLAVEMEGAAVAQVCADHGVAFAAVRTISDGADDTAHVDFTQFVDEVASRYAREIVTNFLTLLQKP
jgi:adenosylhomocysteine nucleosidase